MAFSQSNASPSIIVTPDHFCIVVADLGKAIQGFQSAGFTITAGAESSGGSNALIGFDDGTYIELMCFPRPRLQSILLAITRPLGLIDLILSGNRKILQRFIRHWTNAPRGEWVDWAFRASPLLDAAERGREAGIDIVPEAYPYQRPNADGDTAKWSMIGTVDTSVPFLIEDAPGFAPRVPRGEDDLHQNGAHRLKSVIIATPQPEHTLADLRKLTGGTIERDRILIGEVSFVVEAAPERRMAAPLELVFSVRTGAISDGLIDQKHTGGARIRLER